MKYLISLFCWLIFTNAFGQKNDTLTYQRNLFTTSVILNNQKLSPQRLKSIYAGNPTAARKQKMSRVMLFSSPVLMFGGAYMATEALIGVKKTAIQNGKEVTYVDRNLPELLLGLATFVVGGSFLEGSNDLTVSAAKAYNYAIGKKNTAHAATTLDPRLGILADGNVGLRIEF